jgi:hypothetical protein
MDDAFDELTYDDAAIENIVDGHIGAQRFDC